MATLPPNAKTATDVLDTCFLETRAKLIEIAANLDRIDRARGTDLVKNDPRLAFVRQALRILQGPGPDRAEKILRLYSLPELPR